MRLKLLSFFIFISLFTYGGADRGGYIAYTYNSGTGKYDFKIYTWTNATVLGADYCDLTLYIDGGIDTVICQRINGTAPCPLGGGGLNGIIIDPPSGGYGGVRENIYQGLQSVYLNVGMHVFTTIDVNRDVNINNIPNSTGVDMAITDTLYLYGGVFYSPNNSPIVSFPPIDNACVGTPFCYNPGIIDPDHDSLDFSISRSYMDDPNNSPAGITQIGFETIPTGFSINRHTGTLCWSSSSAQGEYDISILIKEYKISFCSRVLVGKTLLDIPIHVVACPTLNMFYTSNISDTCIVAGNAYSVQANLNSSGSVTTPLNISAVGSPFTSANIGANATFSATSSGNTATGILNWSPACDAVNLFPYNVTIRTFDNSVPANARYETFSVKVIPPPPTNLTATSVSHSVTSNWTAPINCGQATGNILTNYDIYRIDSCINFIPTVCQTGAPSSYLNVGASSTTSYTDTNAPNGTHSYIAVARFFDCSASVPSSSTCVIVTGIENISLNKKISIYPNPTANQISVSIENISDPRNSIITIQNTLGQTVKKTSLTKNVDVSDLSQGCYFIEIILSCGETYKTKFIKQ
jgi:hypothetical protein